ncbi:epoxyqueuosine reductase [Parvibaculum sp.]|jgi:ferredoxin|uniref:epoxyqueuosine reductase n=1 Tax=Parvibaculum sp. TaxID=2024848 RepID=UPI002A2B9DB6|nr:4Fe-4S ferredoxin [Parvibaculum sp.]
MAQDHERQDTSEHPDIARWREGSAIRQDAPPFSAAALRALMLDCGADDCGFVDVADPAVADQRAWIAALLPGAKTLVSFVCRMNRDTVRTSVRSVANEEFHQTYDDVNHVARRAVRRLEEMGIGAVNPAAAFPMEAQAYPAGMRVISHKPIAEAAGLGKMGLHRNVIHPRFGSFILLGTIVIDREIESYSSPLDYSPCLDCKLCVAACPVEAIGMDGSFNFSACYTHNYREFMGGFVDWVHEVVEAEDADDYDARVSPGESVSMWQSLSFKPGYKAAYCLSVCPAGSDVLGPYVEDKVEYRKRILDPLLAKPETVYVLKNSDAEESVPQRLKTKDVKVVDYNIPSDNPFSFLFGLTLTFQRRKARGLDALLALTVSDHGPMQAAIRVRKSRIEIGFAAPENPDASLSLDWPLLYRIFRDGLSMAEAVKAGASLSGDIEKAEAIRNCFPVYRPRR